MNYETWREPGKTGRTYYIFFGLKDTKELEAAAKIIATERKIAVKKIGFSTAWIKGDDLYLGNGPVVGAKKAIAFYRRGK